MTVLKHRENLIAWLLDQYMHVLNEDCPYEINTYKKIFLNKYHDFCKKIENMYGFYEYLTLKYQIRNAYLQMVSLRNCDFWCSGNIEMNPSNLSSYLQSVKNFYARTSGSKQQIKAESNFKREFIAPVMCNSTDYAFYLTDSGMSAVNLAIHLSHYFSHIGPLYVQKDLYYEVFPVLKAVYKQVNFIDVGDIYDLLASDSEISCIFAEYTRQTTIENPLSLQELLLRISHHKQKSLLFVILDRTFFSLDDQFYDLISKIKLPHNTVIISVESLLKHHQYGLDMVNLGACFIYSSMCHKKIFLDVTDLLYNALSCRPNPMMCDRLFPFNKKILENQFNIAKSNAALLHQSLVDFSVIPVTMSKNTYISTADILYIPVHNFEIGEEIISRILKKQAINHGQSFGFDITRLCCEKDILTKEVYLRISVGTEDETVFEQMSIYMRDILKHILGNI